MAPSGLTKMANRGERRTRSDTSVTCTVQRSENGRFLPRFSAERSGGLNPSVRELWACAPHEYQRRGLRPEPLYSFNTTRAWRLLQGRPAQNKNLHRNRKIASTNDFSFRSAASANGP